jgi:hypothetical protein
MDAAYAGDLVFSQCDHPNFFTMRPMIFFLTFLFLRPCVSDAQFLKNIINNVKQTAQSRANGKANQATNKALDQADSATRIGGHGGGTGPGGGTAGAGGGLNSGGSIDTSGMGRVLGAFAKTAAENPNDTNRADLLMKSLGRIAGGDGVSAADSAAAIKRFSTASGGSGVLYESLVTTTSKNGTTKDTTYNWFTKDGEGRAEMSIPMPGMKMPKFVVIGRADQPQYSISLSPEDKTYSLNVIDTAFLNSSLGKYQVTRLGTETVAGYPCIHSKIVTTVGSGMFKSSSSMEVWTSTAVPGYALYSQLLSLQGSQAGMFGALNKAGASGFLVKMTAGDGKEYTMTMQLFHAEEKSFPASLFAIPSGYAKSETTMMQRMMQGAAPAKSANKNKP